MPKQHAHQYFIEIVSHNNDFTPLHDLIFTSPRTHLGNFTLSVGWQGNAPLGTALREERQIYANYTG
jgi:hypothetical protein